MKFNLILFFTMLLFILSCKSNKQVLETTADMNYIIFGNGGGFAGSLTQYKLFENGKIEKQDGHNVPFISHSTIDKNLCDQIFNSVSTLSLDKKQIHDPGNLYHFITVKNEDMMMNFKWGGMNDAPDPAVKNYYNLLNNIANRKEVVKE